MRKVFSNKWLLLTAFLTISLSAFTVITYNNTTSACPSEKECCQRPAPDPRNGEMLWDAISRQFITIITVH